MPHQRLHCGHCCQCLFAGGHLLAMQGVKLFGGGSERQSQARFTVPLGVLLSQLPQLAANPCSHPLRLTVAEQTQSGRSCISVSSAFQRQGGLLVAHVWQGDIMTRCLSRPQASHRLTSICHAAMAQHNRLQLTICRIVACSWWPAIHWQCIACSPVTGCSFGLLIDLGVTGFSTGVSILCSDVEVTLSVRESDAQAIAGIPGPCCVLHWAYSSPAPNHR